MLCSSDVEPAVDIECCESERDLWAGFCVNISHTTCLEVTVGVFELGHSIVASFPALKLLLS